MSVVAVALAWSVWRSRQREAEKPGGTPKEPPKAKWLIGFDFDCTLTVRHFYKVFAWGFASGNENAHVHCQALFEWCRGRGFELQPVRGLRHGEPDIMGVVLDAFCDQVGDDAFHEVFREVFLGGSERIRAIADWLSSAKEDGVEFAIVTAGTSSAVTRALCGVPEWQPFFPSDRVWDTSQGRHSVRTVMAQKAFMFRDICPQVERILLMDDSYEKDPLPAWILDSVRIVPFPGQLPYEASGIGQDTLEQMAEIIGNAREEKVGSSK